MRKWGVSLGYEGPLGRGVMMGLEFWEDQGYS